ncbi:Sulfatase [Novipirellula aureliae]|uniref:Sulfatase n=1 Tax=Novipirellula aureliae TaxID=2527966 RepID=A0A5C6E9X3_9BACT|nr:sulfatase-like hydrolase/transferase [Novipirellula aureliae]TWU45648.1 Sulfatase [Novipirellula aureliae]
MLPCVAFPSASDAESLEEAGYATGHFGKWHLAGKDRSFPSHQGFDETYDSFGNGELQEGAKGNKKGPQEDPKGVFTLTRKACDFIERNHLAETNTVKRDERIDDLLAWFDSADALLPEKANPKDGAEARRKADQKARLKN